MARKVLNAVYRHITLIKDTEKTQEGYSALQHLTKLAIHAIISKNTEAQFTRLNKSNPPS